MSSGSYLARLVYGLNGGFLDWDTLNFHGGYARRDPAWVRASARWQTSLVRSSMPTLTHPTMWPSVLLSLSL